MNDPNDKSSTLIQTAKILWFGFLSTPLLMLIVAWIVAAPQQDALPSSGSVSDPIFLIFCLIAVVDFVLAQNLHRFVNSSRGTQSSASSQGEAVDLRKGYSLFIVRLALFEAIALLGFVAALLRTNVLLYIPFLLLSLAGLLISSPSEALLRHLARPRREQTSDK
jgi:hypothetical protein